MKYVLAALAMIFITTSCTAQKDHWRAVCITPMGPIQASSEEGRIEIVKGVVYLTVDKDGHKLVTGASNCFILVGGQ